MKFNYVEQFGDVVSNRVYVGPCKGRTADGEFIIPVQVRQGDVVIEEGDLLFFRNNSLSRIMLEEQPVDGWAPCGSHQVSRNGVWLTPVGGNNISTEGYGFVRK